MKRRHFLHAAAGGVPGPAAAPHAAFADKPEDEAGATMAYAGTDPMAETQETLRQNMALYEPLKAVSEAGAAVKG